MQMIAKEPAKMAEKAVQKRIVARTEVVGSEQTQTKHAVKPEKSWMAQIAQRAVTMAKQKIMAFAGTKQNRKNAQAPEKHGTAIAQPVAKTVKSPKAQVAGTPETAPNGRGIRLLSPRAK